MKSNKGEYIYTKSDPETIKNMFSSIAFKYDKANAILSFNLHKSWNKQLIQSLLKHADFQPSIFLDLCSGTGDIALEILKTQRSPSNSIHCLDFCPEMLKYAQKKLETYAPIHQLEFIQGDAQKIPFENEKVDCISIAYGIRNVKMPEMCIQESYRTLKKGGVIGILELTQPSNKFLKFGHEVYLKRIMPLLGKIVATNKDAYRYLCNSIESFISPNTLMEMLKDYHFQDVIKKPLLGGIATILIAKKQ